MVNRGWGKSLQWYTKYSLICGIGSFIYSLLVYTVQQSVSSTQEKGKYSIKAGKENTQKKTKAKSISSTLSVSC